LFCAVVLYFVVPPVVEIYTGLQKYNAEQIANQTHYKEVTTPLPRSVVEDLCSKFGISPDDPRCLPDSVVYGPDFYTDLKAYFKGLPQEKQTFATVEEILGPYVMYCEEPDKEGDYDCTYDLRGDGKYRIGVFFTKDNYYYRVIATISGS